MSWAVYGHLPASGLGERDPRRPYVTGGLGGGVFVLVPGPAGELIILYGSPVLEYIEEIITDAVLFAGVQIGQADLNWVRVLNSLATLVYVDSPRAAELVFAEIPQSGLWRVAGPYQAQAVAGVITTALTGAEVPLSDAELEQADDLEASLTGVLLPDTVPALYAGRVLSSQES